jgi:activator of HSP90 ATPase
MARRMTRAMFSARAVALLPVIAAGATTAAFAAPATRFSGTEKISRTAEAIHQEIVLQASAQRVYAALTEAKRFNEVVRLSAAMNSGMSAGMAPTQIAADAGGAFSLFAGHIVGRHIELVPGRRIVQAWRAVNWDAGVYSIVIFGLVEQGAATKIVFEHTGFPAGAAQTLADGWNENYWEPLAKYLAQSSS